MTLFCFHVLSHVQVTHYPVYSSHFRQSLHFADVGSSSDPSPKHTVRLFYLFLFFIYLFICLFIYLFIIYLFIYLLMYLFCSLISRLAAGLRWIGVHWEQQ